MIDLELLRNAMGIGRYVAKEIEQERAQRDANLQAVAARQQMQAMARNAMMGNRRDGHGNYHVGQDIWLSEDLAEMLARQQLRNNREMHAAIKANRNGFGVCAYCRGKKQERICDGCGAKESLA